MAKKHPPFRFKQFSVEHAKSAMKVGTDGVLLGAWTNLANSMRVLDIGTGSGLIALMIAQRSASSTRIDAVEIDPDESEIADENVRRSPWPEKVRVFHGAIQEFDPPYKYDLIISNPPFFSDSYEPPDPRRVKARHTISLSFEDLVRNSQRLLTAGGRLSVILPEAETKHFLRIAEGIFHCSRLWSFRSRTDKPIERFLVELALAESSIEMGEIVLYKSAEEWSDEYKKLTSEFYLRL